MTFSYLWLLDKDLFIHLFSLFCTQKETNQYFRAGLTYLYFQVDFRSLHLQDSIYLNSDNSHIKSLFFLLATEAKTGSFVPGLFISVVQTSRQPPGKVLELNGLPRSRLTVFHSLIREWEADFRLLGIFTDTDREKLSPILPFSPTSVSQRRPSSLEVKRNVPFYWMSENIQWEFVFLRTSPM